MKLSKDAEQYRFGSGKLKTNPGDTFGCFEVPYKSFKLKVIICDGSESGWDHVSVSLPNRCPNWEEMSFIKDQFFGGDETVIQFHPKKSEYVNNHPYCLHLWKPYNQDIPLPPSEYVGIKGITSE